MNHLQVWFHETHVPKKEREWLFWAEDAERHFGHSLDGDQKENGYSLDFAYEAFEQGIPAMTYVLDIVEGANYHPRKDAGK